MKLIIDIPDNQYNQICELRLHNRTIYDDAIRNGIPFEESFINKPCVSSEVCEHDKNKVLDKIRDEMQKEKENIHFDLNEQKAKWVNSGIYDGLTWAQEIIDKYTKGESE